MKELCDRELVSSQRTGLTETGKAADNEVNIRLEVEKTNSLQEPSSLFEAPSNPPQSKLPLHPLQKTHQSPN
jgi:hypothetical protein